MLGAVERADAGDANHGAACALDLRPHRGETAGEVHHFGLARRVLDQRLALGERGRHHQVLGPGDRDKVHHDARPAQALAAVACM